MRNIFTGEKSFCQSYMVSDYIGCNANIAMRSVNRGEQTFCPHLVKLFYAAEKFLKIPTLAEHENAAVLNSIAGDEQFVFAVQECGAAGCVSGNMNCFKGEFAGRKDIAFIYRFGFRWGAGAGFIVRELRCVHVLFIKLMVAADMIRVRVCGEEFDMRVGN